MAEREGKRRKVGGIDIDYAKLLSSGAGDDEPLPLVIQKMPEKSKPLSELMDDGKEESSFVPDVKTLTDDELRLKTSRLKKNLPSISVKLPDGGQKYRLSIEAHEAELERRSALKADGKSIAASPVDVASHDDDDDDSPCEVPHFVPAPKSTFALRFSSQLDENNATNSFSDQLSILNGDLQNEQLLTRRAPTVCLSSRPSPFRSHHPSDTRANMEQSSSQFSTSFPGRCEKDTSSSHQKGRAPTVCLSSRPSPFRSPYHRSDARANMKQSSSQFSTSFPGRCEKDTSSSHQKGMNAPQFEPSRKSTRMNKALVLVDEEEPMLDVESQPRQVFRSKDHRIYYPSRDDPEAIEIYYSDLENLAPESYLSSTIMNFYIRYLQKPASTKAKNLHGYHFFNTYFYEKLKGDVLNKADRENSFVKFRRWWKGVNIFEKAFIFLPIYEKEHWSLVIIRIPTKETGSGPVIFHLDSLEFHTSQSVFKDVRSFLVEEWKFLRKEGSAMGAKVPIADHIWDKLSRRINEKVVEVPQQSNVYDCGLFVLYFMERFIEANSDEEDVLAMFGREWFRPEEASDLRRRIKDLLIREFEEEVVS